MHDDAHGRVVAGCRPAPPATRRSWRSDSALAGGLDSTSRRIDRSVVAATGPGGSLRLIATMSAKDRSPFSTGRPSIGYGRIRRKTQPARYRTHLAQLKIVRQTCFVGGSPESYRQRPTPTERATRACRYETETRARRSRGQRAAGRGVSAAQRRRPATTRRSRSFQAAAPCGSTPTERHLRPGNTVSGAVAVHAGRHRRLCLRALACRAGRAFGHHQSQHQFHAQGRGRPDRRPLPHPEARQEPDGVRHRHRRRPDGQTVAHAVGTYSIPPKR